MRKVRFSLTIIKIFMKNQMQDKSNVLLDLMGMFSRCFIVFLLYGYIFKLNGGMINEVDYKTTMWSMFIYFCIMILGIRRADSIIMNEVKSGNVEMFLNKPANYVGLTFCKVIGKGLFSFLAISLVGTLIIIFVLGVPNLNLPLFIPTFFVTLLLGQLLGLIIYSIVGLLAFFIQDIRPIHWIVDKLVMVLGGSYLPISMFPLFMKKFAYISPFGAINFASSSVYESWNSECFIRLGIQGIWIFIFSLLLLYIFKQAKNKAMINGG